MAVNISKKPILDILQPLCEKVAYENAEIWTRRVVRDLHTSCCLRACWKLTSYLLGENYTAVKHDGIRQTMALTLH